MSLEVNCTELRKLALILSLRLNVLLTKYTAAGFRSRFILSMIDNFDSDKDSLIILQLLFEERKAFAIHVPFSPSNESSVKTFY